MANIYDVNAAIDKPNILGAVQQGLQFGQQQRQQRLAEQDRQQVRNLAPQIIAGDPAAFSQAAAINPEAAGQFQQAGDSQVRRFKGFVDYIDKARQTAQQTGDLRALNAALQQGAPYITQLTGKPAPTEWTPDMEPGWEALKAKIALAGSGAEQQRNAVVSPGSAIVDPATGKLVYERPFAPANAQTFEQDVDGVPTRFTFNPRTQQYERAVIGGAPSGVPTPQGPPQLQPTAGDETAIIEQQIGRQLTQQERQQIASGTFNLQVPAPVQPQIGAQAGGVPLIGRRKEDEARAVTAAQEQAKIDSEIRNYRELTGLAAEREAATTEAKGRVETRLELEQALPKVIADSENTAALIRKALNHPGRATATGASSVYDPRNRLPGTDATDFLTLLDQLKGGTFLQAFQSLKGGGAITQVEGTKAEQAIARLSTAQSDAEFEVALKDLLAIAEGAPVRARQKLSGLSRSQQPVAAPVQRARNPQTGETLELRNGQWVRAQ